MEKNLCRLKLAALTGFVEVMIFILIVSRVIQDVQHWPSVLAYAAALPLIRCWACI